MANVAVHVGQTEVSSAVAVGQPFMVQSHQVENGRMQVMDVDYVLDSVPAEVVGGAVDHASPYAAAGQPHREAERMVLAAVLSLGRWCATELTSPQDERFVEQPTGLEIG